MRETIIWNAKKKIRGKEGFTALQIGKQKRGVSQIPYMYRKLCDTLASKRRESQIINSSCSVFLSKHFQVKEGKGEF